MVQKAPLNHFSMSTTGVSRGDGADLGWGAEREGKHPSGEHGRSTHPLEPRAVEPQCHTRERGLCQESPGGLERHEALESLHVRAARGAQATLEY